MPRRSLLVLVATLAAGCASAPPRPPEAPPEPRPPAAGQPTYDETVRWLADYARANARWLPGAILAETARVQEGRPCQLLLDKARGDRTRTTIPLEALEPGAVTASPADGGQGCAWIRPGRAALARTPLDRSTGAVTGEARPLDAESVCFGTEEQATRFAEKLRYAAGLCRPAR
jgi:hypothetical protein